MNVTNICTTSQDTWTSSNYDFTSKNRQLCEDIQGGEWINVPIESLGFTCKSGIPYTPQINPTRMQQPLDANTCIDPTFKKKIFCIKNKKDDLRPNRQSNTLGFSGDNLKCCFRDMNYRYGKINFDADPTSFKNNDKHYTRYVGLGISDKGFSGPDSCFDSDDRINVCDPKFRDITLSNCNGPVTDYCSGADIPDLPSTNIFSELNSRWNKKECYYALTRLGFDSTNSTYINPNSGDIILKNLENGLKNDNFLRSAATDKDANQGANIMNDLYTTLKTQNINLYDNDKPTDSNDIKELKTKIYNICKSTPFLCEKFLNDLCISSSNNQKLISKEELKNNPEKIKWCGCYMDKDEYSFLDKFGGKPCHYFCNLQQTIEAVYSTDDKINPINSRQICNNAVCNIDDTNLSLFSNNNETINIEQICKNCTGETQCSCTIDETNITSINSSNNIINIKNSCGTNSTKTVKGSDGETYTVPLNTPDNTTLGELQRLSKTEKGNTDNKNSNIYIILVCIIVIIFLGLLIYLLI